jgi:hypothetical protein
MSNKPDTFDRRRTIIAFSGISPTAKLLWLVYEDRAGETREAWLSVPALAAAIGISVRSVHYARRELLQLGALMPNGYHTTPSHARTRQFKVVDPQELARRTCKNLQAGSLAEPAKSCRLDHVESAKSCRLAASRTCKKAPFEPAKSCTQKEQERNIQERAKARSLNRSKKTTPFRQLTSYFTEQWAARYPGTAYSFNGAADAQAAKRILAAVDGDLGQAKRVADAYLGDTDPFVEGHPLVKLASKGLLPKYLARLSTPVVSSNPWGDFND